MNIAKNAPAVREHLGWVDIIRILACVLVIVQHCSDPFYMNFDLSGGDFYAGCGLASLSRPCVPLFVMITGILLLPTKDAAGTFYRKRIGRILPPLVFWSLLLPWVDFAWLGNLWNSTSPAFDASGCTLEATLRKCYTFIFNFNYSTTPLWYLYMLIGLYLIMPILGGWMRSASKRDLQVAIAVWLVSTFLPYIRLAAPLLGYEGNYGNMGLWGECDWTSYGSLYYVSGFAGYLVLGHYLHTYPLRWSMRRTLLVFVPMFLAGFAISFGGYVLMAARFPGQYAYLEIVWWTCGINVVLQTVPVFVILKKWFSGHHVPTVAAKIAALTFGIYLCHFPLAQISYDIFQEYLPAGIPAAVRILINVAVAFAVSAVVVKALKACKLTKRFVA